MYLVIASYSYGRFIKCGTSGLFCIDAIQSNTGSLLIKQRKIKLNVSRGASTSREIILFYNVNDSGWTRSSKFVFLDGMFETIAIPTNQICVITTCKLSEVRSTYERYIPHSDLGKPRIDLNLHICTFTNRRLFLNNGLLPIRIVGGYVQMRGVHVVENIGYG
jgi:hypothetical protein